LNQPQSEATVEDIKQSLMINRVKRGAQVKQNQCSDFATIDCANDIIHDADYGGLSVVISTVNRLIRWKQFVTFSMLSKPCRNNSFDKLRDETQRWCFTTMRYTNPRLYFTLLYFDIGRYELASSASSVGFFSRGKTMADLCVAGSSPDCRDALHSALSTGARTSDACLD